MYRLDFYNRNKDGHKGSKAYSIWYPTESEAKAAKQQFITLKSYKGTMPMDIEAAKRKNKPKNYGVWKFPNLIITDPIKDNKF